MTTTESEARRGITLMLLAVVFFSANTLLLRGVSLHIPEADGWMATTYRGGVGLAIVLGVYGFGRGFSARGLLGSRLVVLRGVVGAISLAAFYVTIERIGASRAVVLNLSYPVFATLLAVPMIGETLSGRALLWVGAGFAGLVSFVGSDALAQGFSRYDLVGIAGAAGAGLVVVLVRKLIRTEHASTIFGSQCLFCLLLALPVSFGKLASLPIAGHAGLAGASVLVTVGQLLMTHGFKLLPVSRGSAIQMLIPLITAAGAFLCFGEHLGPIELVSAVVILLATWRVARAR